MNPYDFAPEYYKNEPDTTQRSIIELARKRLEGITVKGDFVDIPVMRADLSVFYSHESPQDWDVPGYVVTFRRTENGWEPIEIK